MTALRAIKLPQIAPCAERDIHSPHETTPGNCTVTSHGMRAPIPAEAPNPPISPSTVLPGLMDGAIFAPDGLAYEQGSNIAELRDDDHPKAKEQAEAKGAVFTRDVRKLDDSHEVRE